jgi:hypothetical protein
MEVLDVPVGEERVCSAAFYLFQISVTVEA